MARVYEQDDATWKKIFGVILRELFNLYSLDYTSFASRYHWSEATVRYWFKGRSLPKEGLTHIKEYFCNNIFPDSSKDEKLYEKVKNLFDRQDAIRIYYELRKNYPSITVFAGEVLETCYLLAKKKIDISNSCGEIPTTGKTQVVVFDFDGTLTTSSTKRTTWESIWVGLGYDVKCCQELHMRFSRGEITHNEWCQITENYFRNRHLHRDMIEKISKKIRLIKGTKKTLEELHRRDIKIYIVSGSIMTVIRSVIRPVYQYIDGIKANEFRFGEDGLLKEIIGTKYDFEGKASYISELSKELRVNPSDILFVGNSINDQFAYTSGAHTLCINPQLTDIANSTMWNYCILSCRNLTEILNYIK